MKTIHIRLDDTTYIQLEEMLESIGLTMQEFYETYTMTVLKEEGRQSTINMTDSKENRDDKMKAFERLENLRNASPITSDCEKEREEAMNEKYGILD